MILRCGASGNLKARTGASGGRLLQPDEASSQRQNAPFDICRRPAIRKRRRNAASVAEFRLFFGLRTLHKTFSFRTQPSLPLPLSPPPS